MPLASEVAVDWVTPLPSFKVMLAPLRTPALDVVILPVILPGATVMVKFLVCVLPSVTVTVPLVCDVYPVAVTVSV